MPDMNIDLEILENAIGQQGRMAIDAFMEAARETVRSGARVIVRDSRTSVERIITYLEDLEAWRKQVTPVPLKRLACPNCGRPLKHMSEKVEDRLKCYDPPGCGAIYRLADGGLHLIKFDEKGGQETQYPANEL